MNGKSNLAVVALATALFPWARAQELSIPEQRSFIAESVYVYNVRRYVGGNEYTLEKEESVDRGNLESSMVHFFRSMSKGDFELNQSLWTPDSRELMRQRDKRQKKSKDEWIREWRAFYSGRTLRFLRKVEFGSYRIVEYETFRSGAAAAKDTLVMASIGGKWYATNMLSDDPILQNWMSDNKRVQTIPSAYSSMPR
jgi:hypothetical protein